jgi:hypothetical protein
MNANARELNVLLAQGATSRKGIELRVLIPSPELVMGGQGLAAMERTVTAERVG